MVRVLIRLWACPCRGNKTLVHRWYEPDSYDSCLPAAVAPEALEPDKRIRGAPPCCRTCSLLHVVPDALHAVL
jgi:hypothetical protein